MAQCKDCKQEMLTAEGCDVTHLIDSKGRVYVRSLENWAGPGKRCHDCAAMFGKPHHFGCDEERCPKCGIQIISCECAWLSKQKLKKRR